MAAFAAGQGLAADDSSGLSEDDLAILHSGSGAPPDETNLPPNDLDIRPVQPSAEYRAVRSDPYLRGSAPLQANEGFSAEPLSPPFLPELSLTMRGTFVTATEGDRFQITAVPRAGISHTGSRSAWSVEASAELTQVIQGEFLPSSAGVSGDYSYQLDNDTGLSLRGALNVERQSVNDPTLATNVEQPPLTFSGDAGAELTRQFGKLGLGIAGSVSRTLVGDTVLTGGVVQSNAERSNTAFGGALRASFELSPILTVFGEGTIDRTDYDAASVTLGTSSDGWTYGLRGGLRASWSGGLSGEASAGYGWRMFDSASLATNEAMLYAASVTYAPNETVSATAAFSTEFALPPSGSTSASEVTYAVNGSASYQINSLIGLRASLGWSWAQPTGATTFAQTWSAGAGADVVLNDNVTLAADYGFARSEGNAALTSDSHTISAGITVSN
jgi:hypothetical protein